MKLRSWITLSVWSNGPAGLIRNGGRTILASNIHKRSSEKLYGVITPRLTVWAPACIYDSCVYGIAFMNLLSALMKRSCGPHTHVPPPPRPPGLQFAIWTMRKAAFLFTGMLQIPFMCDAVLSYLRYYKWIVVINFFKERLERHDLGVFNLKWRTN